ncbi:CAF17-like 4Fe-4S cluster assembly/insertion protein YgfZ [Phytohabitans rumicis]|uniref:Folate-binding protein n=1 Tax=Phytohabitans rumicis TaxID=1076125 RepID=A0A6V8L493_9ACTN|nr:folate-binding protein YgfZ [Phytohabitans rumicis]GFJ91024.1 folate-binding protein [Phytohabitans rumicis]
MIDIAGAVAVEAIEPQSRDAGVAAHYGDPMREQRTLATGVGLVDRSNRGVLAVPGAERASWLHSITTQHLADLRAGQGTELLVLSPHGHVEYHAQVAEDGTTTWLDTEPGAAADLLTFLEKMRFLTRVDPRDASAEWAVLTLVGPRATELFDLKPPQVRAVPGAKFAAGSVPPLPTTEYDVRVLPEGGLARRGRLGIDLIVPRDSIDDVIRRLDVPLAGLWAYEAMRVAARVPRLGLETDHRTIPAEIDLIGPAVHLDKGCYRGQETVARVHNLGRPPRRLVLLHLDGIATDQPPAPGTAVTAADGRAVGFVGTAVRHFELGMIALAVLKRNVPDDAVLRIGESTAAIDLG